MSDTPQVLSYGGGRQTVAMTLLTTKTFTVRGETKALPRPDKIVFADTGREAQSTWDYLERYVQPYLAEFDMQVEVAPHSLSTVDLYAKNGDLLLPVFTSTGKMMTFCSNEWKGRVVHRYLRSQGVKSAVQWIGFSLDEARRVKGNGTSPWFKEFPLINLGLSRTDCEQIITDHGWPLPEKSACWMCPNRTNEEWRYIRDHEPENWAKAVEIDEEIRDVDIRGDVYLHQSRVPLAEADLDAVDRKMIDRACASGNCMV